MANPLARRAQIRLDAQVVAKLLGLPDATVLDVRRDLVFNTIDFLLVGPTFTEVPDFAEAPFLDDRRNQLTEQANAAQA